MLHHIRSSFSGLPRAIWILALVSFCNRIGTMVVGFMTLYFNQYLHFSIERTGYASACFGVGAISGVYIGGILTDKFGYYRVQLASLFGSGLMFLLAMNVRSFEGACIIMFFLALISESFRPANSVAVLFHSNETIRTRCYSLLRVGVNLAVGLAFLVGGILITFGWHWLFLVDSLSGFGAAAIVFFFLKNESPKHIKLKNVNSETETLSAYKDKQFLIFILFTLTGAIVFMQFIWTVPIFFKTIYGWNEATIGLVIAFNCAIVMFVEMPLIFSIENKKNPLWFVRLGLLCYAIAFAALILPVKFAIISAVIYIIVISFGEILVMPFSSNWATTRAGASRQGQYMALYNMAYSSCSIFSPMLGTQIIGNFSFNYLWIILLMLCGIAMAGFYFLEKRKKIKI